MTMLRVLCVVVVMAGLVACGTTTRVVLLPQADGRATAVEVSTPSGAQRVDRPYQTAEVDRRGNVRLGRTDAQAVQARYGATLGQLPAADETFVLYFEIGGATLTAASQGLLPAIVMRARQRPGGEIIVVGHTDRVGALLANDALSLERAQAIRAIFVAQGFAPELVDAVGRGERAPLVATDDEVEEPQNRRAEILVR